MDYLLPSLFVWGGLGSVERTRGKRRYEFNTRLPA